YNPSNEKSFAAEIVNLENGFSYNLEGGIKQILSEDQAYYYTGIDKNNELTKFEAVVEKISEDDYVSTINIYEYEDINDKEPTNANTFTFNGKGSELNKYKQESERRTIEYSLSDKTNDTVSPLALEDYYEHIQKGWGKGYKYYIQGPLTTRRDSGNNYSFRWGTDIQDIEKMLKEKGVKHTGSHDIVDFRLRIYTDEPIVFNTVDPINSSTNTFSVPMRFGDYIGVQWIPVVTDSVSIKGSGTDNLLYTFKWNSTYFPSGYLDERDFDEKPSNKNGFAVRYFMDTSPNISTGDKIINFNGYFKYRTLYSNYGLLLNHYTEITKTDYYLIEITK
ncbi:hypothetical protein P4V33_21590, partial [Brevibacillus borstelensis]|uniref:hypothetical protein n=1 Tax=Brevibacillus borstelensis TaxID=45462 RepID=UPI002E21E59C|nr:hypothetical protein [Brevibacillus borstelensis]